eukprot:460465-Rhodomonas_salina.1
MPPNFPSPPIPPLIAAVQAFAQEDPAVPPSLRSCPQWFYTAMPCSLRNKLQRIADGRDQGHTFLDRACSLGESVPELAAIAHPPRATHEVSAVASPPVAILVAVLGTTWKIAHWTGVIDGEARSNAHARMASVKNGKKPRHSAAARLDSLQLVTIIPEDKAAAETPMCAICQVEFKATDIGYVFKGCNHPFHVKCMNNWLERGNSCPCCRKPLQTSQQHPSASHNSAEAAHPRRNANNANSDLLGPAVRAYMDAHSDGWE